MFINYIGDLYSPYWVLVLYNPERLFSCNFLSKLIHLLYEIPFTFLASGEVSITKERNINKNVDEFITVHQNRGNIGDKEPTNI